MARVARGRPKPPSTDDLSLYLNRELSWVDFNHRVLQLAADEHTPLLERLRFHAIYANNLDEFFMVRVAGLVDHASAGTTPSDGRGPDEVLHEIADRVRALESELEANLHGSLLPSLAAEGLRVLTLAECTPAERRRLTEMFEQEIFPVLTPLAVGPGRPFPYISNLSLSLGVFVVDPPTGEQRFARVKVPEVLPRFLALERGHRYVALEDVIADNLHRLFPGMEFTEHATFRVTRDADYDISEAAEDLLEAVEQELHARRFGDVVRLEVEDTMSDEMRGVIVAALRVHPDHVYRARRPLDLADFFPLASLDRPDLHYRPWTPQTQPRLNADSQTVDMFAEIRRGDILVHHPYDAFSSSVERFIEQAVDDPDVLAIKHTIYRTSGDSPIVPALVRAAEQGKQAVAMVEVTARFDEERNIRWARSLERAGVHVVYGLAGLKTHCKLAMVVRREEGVARRYVHIGTGNYHPSTARLYTDLGLFTCREDVTADVSDLFNHLTGFGRPQAYRKLWVAPQELRQRLIDEIWRCCLEHDPDQPARMVLKCNGLVDRGIIAELYRASQAGVQIDLIIRGICCLKPGVPGLSENIRVISTLGRFLEHSRIYSFRTAQAETTYIGSADLMPRNLDARIEVITPVEDPDLVTEIDTALDLMLADTAGCWWLDGDGNWHRRRPEPGEAPFSSQAALMERAVAVADGEARGDRREAAAERRLVRRPQPGKPGARATGAT
jgi:polyphosphate kinase